VLPDIEPRHLISATLKNYYFLDHLVGNQISALVLDLTSVAPLLPSGRK
jgi:hypothetical protein